MAADNGVDLGEILSHPETFLGTGPIEDTMVADWLKAMTMMRPEDIGRMAQRYIGSLPADHAGVVLQGIIEGLPPEELGRFFKGRVIVRLKNQSKAE